MQAWDRYFTLNETRTNSLQDRALNVNTMKTTFSYIFQIILLITGAIACTQKEGILTEADYQSAADMLKGNVEKRIDNDIQPKWLKGREDLVQVQGGRSLRV